MDFKAVSIVVLLFLSLSLFFLASSRITRKEKSFDDIVRSAENGKEDYLRLTPKENLDICDLLGATYGCDSKLGASTCRLKKDVTYIIRAHPVESGVCLNVTEVS